LERAGHRVIAPDLPSLGSDKTPISEVSLEMWAESVGQVLDAQTESVVLVGHSRGGVVISQASESRPGKVKVLVYLAAFLLRNGESLMEVAQGDAASHVGSNLVLAEDQGYVTVREEAIQQSFYGGCSDEDVALARLLLQPEALAPLGTPIHVTDRNFGRIPRVYIECLHDRHISPAVQRQMCDATPCQKIISMDTDHSPFFSAPEQLVAYLTSM
jgi:pimeloyl-ACP methyl ester carboxylesterase